MAIAGKDRVFTFRLNPEKPDEGTIAAAIDGRLGGGMTFKALFLELVAAAGGIPSGGGTAPAAAVRPSGPAAASAGYGLEDRFDRNFRRLRLPSGEGS